MAIFRNPPAGPSPHPAAPRIRFVEDKPPDWTRVSRIARRSAEAGRWTNFGPVEADLGRTIGTILRLPPDRTVVPAASATAALFALAGAHAARAGRPLNWAVSAFGFFSTAIGPLAGRVRIVDCDRRGMIDADRLAGLPGAGWDGLIVTDIFGARADLSRLAGLCTDAGKPMIVDAALSFPARQGRPAPDGEVVSFHHTKPWGFGEGGCAVVPTALADTVRALLNFGVGADPAGAAFAANGKLSDVAAALILQRLEAMPDWAPGYILQRGRIQRLAEEAGLDLLVRPAADAVVPHLAVLASAPVALADMPPAPFDVAKYYRPLAGDCPMAADIHARIVNVPCHPGMAEVDDRDIRAFFAALAGLGEG